MKRGLFLTKSVLFSSGSGFEMLIANEKLGILTARQQRTGGRLCTFL